MPWKKASYTLEPHHLLHLARKTPDAVWLDGSSRDSSLGRRSILGVDPHLVFSCRGDLCEIRENGAIRTIRDDPWRVLDALLARYATRPGPFPLARGAALGYLGYDLGRRPSRRPHPTAGAKGPPDAYLAFFDLLLVQDAVDRETILVSAEQPDQSAVEAERRLAYLERLAAEALQTGRGAPARPPSPPVVHADFSRASYGAMVARAKEYIAAGDIYQVNLSQRFRIMLPEDPSALYLRLRRALPAPFAAFLRAQGEAILCASPERFLRLRGEAIETRPIKGTRPRGRTPDEDRRLAAELLASEKDRAELMMVVDLERNDLSRVCRPGTGKVPRLCGLESYANVHHLVATVTGAIKPGTGTVEVLKAVVPGGSITGVPKIRAMEIIDELEPVRRGIYTGCLGYLGLDGEVDLNIVIRTGWTDRGRFFFQTGGAVTIDSDPEQEYEETLHKAAGMLAALGFAEGGFSPDRLVVD